MAEVTYEIVEHDGGWAYKAMGTFSEPFRTREEALAAAKRAAAEHAMPGEDTPIEWEDPEGHWHEEQARGSDRPQVEVKR